MRIKQIIWILFAILTGMGIFWWTTVKNRVVKKVVTKTVRKKTDSLYKLSYDTAVLDEVGGNAYLYKVRLTLDSAQWLKLVEKDSMPPVTIDLVVDKVTIQGLKTLDLLNNRSLSVTDIILDKPVFRLERWTRKHPPAEALNDTLEIYKRLTGQFDFIKADHIQIKNGDLALVDLLHKDSVMVKDIDVSVDDLLVDSLHNYRDFVSYFIGKTRASAGQFTSKAVSTGKIFYDSKAKIIRVEGISAPGNGFRAGSVSISGYEANEFIARKMLRAVKVVIDLPDITIKKGAPKKRGAGIDLSVSIDSVLISRGRLEVKKGRSATTKIEGIQLALRNVKTVNGKILPENYLDPAGCSFAIHSVDLKMGFHSLNMADISYPGPASRLTIRQLKMKPMITRQQLKTRYRKQADMYTVNAGNIRLDNISLKQILKDTISIGAINMQLDLHVFDDKTLPVDSAKKGRGLFPYDNIRTSRMAIDIGTIYVTNSSISYEEQAPKSQLNGTVRFTDLTGKVTNITNMRSRILASNIMHIEARAKIMGEAPLVSDWRIPLDKTDGSFRITGKVAPFHIPLLNPAFEPLSMSTIRSGEAERLAFDINGNHEGSTGTEVFDYRDLKIDLLRKNKEDSLEKKGLISFIANADIRNSSHSGKAKAYKFKKDRYKSLFNLLWHSVFAGAKETMLIVK